MPHFPQRNPISREVPKISRLEEAEAYSSKKNHRTVNLTLLTVPVFTCHRHVPGLAGRLLLRVHVLQRRVVELLHVLQQLLVALLAHLSRGLGFTVVQQRTTLSKWEQKSWLKKFYCKTDSSSCECCCGLCDYEKKACQSSAEFFFDSLSLSLLISCQWSLGMPRLFCQAYFSTGLCARFKGKRSSIFAISL